MRTALLFPGQGAPAAEWGRVVADVRPDLLLGARRLLGGDDPFERFGTGTEYDQPAIYCATVAAFEIAGAPVAEVHAGHSMGEIAALACAGATSTQDGLRLVVARGRLMADAAEGAGRGAMLAVGADESALADVLTPALAVANLNSPGQTVLSGPDDAIAAAAETLNSRGLRTKRLAVGGAFHSPAMAPAAEGFRAALDDVDFSPPQIPVLSGRNGRPFADIRAELAASLLEPVRWIDVVAELERLRIERCIEVGPGRALRGLVRRTARGDVELVSTPLPEAARA